MTPFASPVPAMKPRTTSATGQLAGIVKSAKVAPSGIIEADTSSHPGGGYVPETHLRQQSKGHAGGRPVDYAQMALLDDQLPVHPTRRKAETAMMRQLAGLLVMVALLAGCTHSSPIVPTTVPTVHTVTYAITSTSLYGLDNHICQCDRRHGSGSKRMVAWDKTYQMRSGQSFYVNAQNASPLATITITCIVRVDGVTLKETTGGGGLRSRGLLRRSAIGEMLSSPTPAT